MPLSLLSALMMLLMQAPAQPNAAAAQTAPPAHPPTDLGYTYRLPEDWEVVRSTAARTAQQMQEGQQSASAEAKKGIACVSVDLTARHGDPPTVVAIVSLPFDCYGQTMNNQDLAGFGAGAAGGLKEAFDITNSLSASYGLAGHEMWAMRARATAKRKTAPDYTVEIVCTLLKKGAVCWVAQAADEAGLRVFESSPVTLDGAAAPALVPANVFSKIP